MGISQRNFTEMCRCFWFPTDRMLTSCRCGVVKLKAFLGACTILSSVFRFEYDRGLRTINFASSTRKQCRFLLHSCPHILITLGSIYLWRNNVLYIAHAIKNRPWHTNILLDFEGKSLVFRSWTSGKPGYIFPSWLHEHVLTFIKWYERKRRKMLNPVFSVAHMRGMSEHVQLFVCKQGY